MTATAPTLSSILDPSVYTSSCGPSVAWYSLNLAWASSLVIIHLLTPSVRLSLRIVFMCSWRKGWCLQGANHFYVNLCRCHGFLYFAGGRVIPPDLLWLGQIHVVHDVLGCQCRYEFSDSNSWTTSTDVPPKELRWPPCTYWKLGWCKMPRVPVLSQRCGCCQVVVNWYWMLCHTQYIHNLASNEQWSSTTSAVCLCPLPTSSVQPLGWDWEPPCTET